MRFKCRKFNWWSSCVVLMFLLFSSLSGRSQDIVGISLSFNHSGAGVVQAELRLETLEELNVERNTIAVEIESVIDFLYLSSTELIGEGLMAEVFTGEFQMPGAGVYTIHPFDFGYWALPVLNTEPIEIEPSLVSEIWIYISNVPNTVPTIASPISISANSGSEFQFAPNIIEVDGDSLSFTLNECNLESYTTTTAVYLDSTTGELIGTLDNIGRHLLCYEVTEFSEAFSGLIVSKQQYQQLITVDSALSVPSAPDLDEFNVTVVNNLVRIECLQECRSKIILYDLQGRTLERHEFRGTEHTLDISSLSSGYYLLKLQSEFGKGNTKRIYKTK